MVQDIVGTRTAEDEMTLSKEDMREEMRQHLEDVSESINFTSWHHAVEFVAWDLVHDRKPLLVDVELVSDYDIEKLRELHSALGEWPEPGTNGERFVPSTEFEPLHAAWTESEAERDRRLQAEDESRRTAPLDDGDMELLERYEGMADGTQDMRGSVVAFAERIHKLRAKGLLEGSSWIVSDISAAGREVLAAHRSRSPGRF